MSEELSRNTFILRADRDIAELEDEVSDLAKLDGIEICNRSTRMLQVLGSEPVLHRFAKEHEGWRVYPHVEYSIPEQRPRPKSTDLATTREGSTDED